MNVPVPCRAARDRDHLGPLLDQYQGQLHAVLVPVSDADELMALEDLVRHVRQTRRHIAVWWVLESVGVLDLATLTL